MTFPMPMFDTAVAAGGGGSGPLDGISGTVSGAWSWSRQFLGSYGGAFSQEASGNTEILFDQFGSNDFLQTATADRPLLATSGAQSRNAGRFDGITDFMVNAAMSNFISVSTGYIIVSAIVNAIDTDSAQPRLNDSLWGDSSQRLSCPMRTSTGTPNGLHAWHRIPGNVITSPGIDISTGVEVVVEWRKEGGTLYARLNGDNEQSIASADIDILTGLLRIGHPFYVFTDCDIFEIVTFSAIPTLADRDTLAADMLSYIN